MKRKDVFNAIKEECLNYKTNFLGIDTLMNLETDYHVATRESTYGFSRCPSSYECMERVKTLCEDFDLDCDMQQCWEQAIDQLVDEYDEE